MQGAAGTAALMGALGSARLAAGAVSGPGEAHGLLAGAAAVDITPKKLVEDELQIVRGVVVETDARNLSSGRTLTATLLDCGSDFVRGLTDDDKGLYTAVHQFA